MGVKINFALKQAAFCFLYYEASSSSISIARHVENKI
jgi:hypothetical protein